MLSTDAKEFYDESQATKIFQNYGGDQWPNVLLGGFDGAMHFGDFGYGEVVIDADGIVRAIGPTDLEKSLERIFKDQNENN